MNKKPFDQNGIAKFSKDVLKGKVFGLVQVDIKYPRSFETSLLFVVEEIPDCDMPQEMKICKK